MVKISHFLHNLAILPSHTDSMNTQTKSKELELAIILARLATLHLDRAIYCRGLIELLRSPRWNDASPQHKAMMLDHQFYRDYAVAPENSKRLMSQTRREIESVLMAC